MSDPKIREALEAGIELVGNVASGKVTRHDLTTGVLASYRIDFEDALKALGSDPKPSGHLAAAEACIAAIRVHFVAREPGYLNIAVTNALAEYDRAKGEK